MPSVMCVVRAKSSTVSGAVTSGRGLSISLGVKFCQQHNLVCSSSSCMSAVKFISTVSGVLALLIEGGGLVFVDTCWSPH